MRVELYHGRLPRSRRSASLQASDTMHTTLPRKFYADADFYRAELERFYFNRWICAGRADQIPGAGDFFTRTIGDDSIIVARDEQGAIHALFNVCRHRGTRLCEKAEGHFVERIQCPYHAWTYDLTGRLLAAPHMSPDFCKDDYPLHRAGCDVWDGHIFVLLGQEGLEGREGLDGRSAPAFAEGFGGSAVARKASEGGKALAERPLRAQLGELPDRFAAYRMQDLRLARSIVYDVRANWKLIVL